MRKWIKQVMVLLVAYLASTCVPSSAVPHRIPVPGQASVDVDVYVAPDFTDNERKNIIKGISMWESASNGLIRWHMLSFTSTPAVAVQDRNTFPQKRNVVFMRATSKTDWVTLYDKKNAPKRLLGMLVGNPLLLSYAYLVEDRLRSNEDEVTIAAHEFGHALGLDHVKDIKSVMSELHLPNVDCLTHADLQALCDLYGCRSSDVHSVCTQTQE